ncbi:DUF2163 domain-containing protein [Gallaecimonas kandeliae]|uniref:DUF2163 domain-containing protein n=1 Tax=Gallaecimonas kandeliae TaxID=3029055 RepID=UPI002647E663|nr:DUF2163 domain-containing protein [Gallaecimonas kandeliae]WKE65081.1 DUF2163 domain-containing protein [Gallaecimonas kandeliae]
MSNADYGQSGYASRPAALLEFRYSSDEANTIRYTSCDHDLTVDGYLYSAMAIESGDWKASGGEDGSTLQLTMPLANNALANLYQVQAPDNEVGFTLRGIELDDPDAEVLTLWIGRVTAVSRQYPKLVVDLEDIESSLDESGNRGYVEPACRHVHYSTGGGRCELVKADWESTDTVTAMASSTVLTLPVAATFADGWFVGGELDFGEEVRTIIAHVGNQLTLNRPILGLAVGSSVTVAPGCDHTAETCLAKYANILNYGGEDFSPDTSPWQGISIV